MNYSSDAKTEIRAVFTSTEKTITTDSITQYDKGLVLRFNIPEGSGLFDITPVVQYSNKKSDETINVVAKSTDDGYTADIPNDLTAEKYDIKAVVYIGTGDTAVATATAIIPVTPRTKPADYTFENNISNDDLVEIKNNMEAQLEANTNLTNETKARMDQLDAADRSDARRAFLNDIGTDGLLNSNPLTEPGLYLCVAELIQDSSSGSSAYKNRFTYCFYIFVPATIFTDYMGPQDYTNTTGADKPFGYVNCTPDRIMFGGGSSQIYFDLAKSNDEITIRLDDSLPNGFTFKHCYLLAKM